MEQTTSQRRDTYLSDAEREQFDRDGFFIIENLDVAEAMLDGIVSEMDDLYVWPPQKDSWYDEWGTFYSVGPRIRDAWHVSAGVKVLALAPVALNILEDLYDRKPLPFQTLNFPVGTQQDPHSDAMHFNSVPTGFMCGVWVALEDMDADNGPLVYYPGSHKLPDSTWENIGFDATPDDFESHEDFMKARHLEYERFIAGVIEREGLKPQYATIEKGQALIWASNLIHGGAKQNDPARTRHSQVTHYYFEGVRSYTPMENLEDMVVWTYPDPVRWDRPKKITPRFVRGLIEGVVPEGAKVAVVSRGDPDLVSLEEREGLHFPQDEDGNALYHHPHDSDQAIALLEAARERGTEYLAIPKNELWWLTHYRALQQHLESKYRSVLRDGGGCVVFELTPQ